MQNLYDEIVKELTKGLERFLNNEISLEMLIELEEKEKLVFEHETWIQKKEELKESIFQLTKQLFEDVNECEQKIKEYEKLDDSTEFDVDYNAITAHAMLMARNKAPPEGYENSNWYLGPFPTIQMLEALNEDEIQ